MEILKAETVLSSFDKAGAEVNRRRVQESRVSKSTHNEVFVFKGQEAVFITTAVVPGGGMLPLSRALSSSCKVAVAWQQRATFFLS